MSYFSSRSTWLSLVDAPEPSILGLDGLTLSFEDFHPCLPTTQGEDGLATAVVSDSAEDLDYLRITRDLRHRLFFHFKEWEFGPGLFEDHVRLAQSQSEGEGKLADYCHARHVAMTLVNRFDQQTFLIAWLEMDRIIAEIHHLLGNRESCNLYAREGLDTIKRNRFDGSMDMRITKLAVRFARLLGG